MPDSIDKKQLIADLKRDEGWRPHVYLDTEGYQTIGFGFLVDARRGDGLPATVGEYWLIHVLERKLHELYRRAPWLADQPGDVQRALANMAYQLGVAGVLNFRMMIAALKAGDRAEARRQALDSRWAIQTPNRARRAADLIGGR